MNKLLDTKPMSTGGMAVLQAMARETIRSKFEAIAACNASGKPTYEQLAINGMLNAA